MKLLSENPTIASSAILESTELGAWTEIGENNILENTVVGDYSYTGPWCILQNTIVGRFSNIAAAVRVGPTQHPMERPSMHHFTYRRRMYGFDTEDDELFFEWRRSRVTSIGHDTWIGHGAQILSGVLVGHGAVIAAGAVVTHDVEPYTIVAGVPAKQLRRRFTEEQAVSLMRICWWDWDHETIKQRLKDFLLPIDSFISRYDPEGNQS